MSSAKNRSPDILAAMAIKPPIGKHVPKAVMYERVMAEMDKTCAVINSSGRLFHVRGRLDLCAGGHENRRDPQSHFQATKILFMKAEESHSGSHAAHAAQWFPSMTGGGSPDPHGLSSNLGGAVSQTSGGESPRRKDHGNGRDRRRFPRQCRGLSAGVQGPCFHQIQSRRRRRLGDADAYLLRRHQRARCSPAT